MKNAQNFTTKATPFSTLKLGDRGALNTAALIFMPGGRFSCQWRYALHAVRWTIRPRIIHVVVVDGRRPLSVGRRPSGFLLGYSCLEPLNKPHLATLELCTSFPSCLEGEGEGGGFPEWANPFAFSIVHIISRGQI